MNTKDASMDKAVVTTRKGKRKSRFDFMSLRLTTTRIDSNSGYSIEIGASKVTHGTARHNSNQHSVAFSKHFDNRRAPIGNATMRSEMYDLTEDPVEQPMRVEDLGGESGFYSSRGSGNVILEAIPFRAARARRAIHFLFA